MLTTNTKMRVYQACVLSTLLYGSESWTLYTRQEGRLNAFHLRSLRKILGITWQDRVPNKDVLARAKIPSMFALLSQRRLRWLGHVVRMQDGRIPKDILYSELTTGTRQTGRPFLRFKDVCKRDLKLSNIHPTDLESTAAERDTWRLTVKSGIQLCERRREDQWEEKRQRRRQRAASVAVLGEADAGFTCSKCNRICRSRICSATVGAATQLQTDFTGRKKLHCPSGQTDANSNLPITSACLCSRKSLFSLHSMTCCFGCFILGTK